MSNTWLANKRHVHRYFIFIMYDFLYKLQLQYVSFRNVIFM